MDALKAAKEALDGVEGIRERAAENYHPDWVSESPSEAVQRACALALIAIAERLDKLTGDLRWTMVLMSQTITDEVSNELRTR